MNESSHTDVGVFAAADHKLIPVASDYSLLFPAALSGLN
jgi:hypothetical protein